MKSTVTYKIITHPEECKKLWEEFSPQLTIDDNWDFRETFIKDLGFELYFLTGYDGDNPVGLLPLQRNTNKGISQKIHAPGKPFLEFFGGVDTDSNTVLLKPGYESLRTSFLEQIKDYAVLSDLAEPLKVGGIQAEYYNDKFILDLKQFQSFDEFLLKNFDGKSRQRLKNRINKLYKEFSVETTKGSEQDLENMFRFSINRFGENSSFNMPYRQDVFKELLRNFETDFFVIKLNGEIKAASFGITYKGTYTSVNNGYDLEVRDLAKILAATQIKRAIETGFETYDGGKGENGWKEHFHLVKVPQYKLVLNG
jgi:CelD/BcsL family acetyltransferase involved in cellulose biosynthesis